MLASLSPGTLPQWGTFLTMLTLLGGVMTVWIKGIPERLRARTAERAEFSDQYVEQIREFRDEVRKCRVEIGALQDRLTLAEAMSSRRGHTINNLTFVLRMLMRELRKLDPDSSVVAQADDMLERMEREERENVRLMLAARKAMGVAVEVKKGEPENADPS